MTTTRKPRAAALAVAIGAPLAIAFSFPHPTRRVIVPAGLMLIVVFVVAILGTRLAAIVGALTSTVSLGYFNLPPGESFDLAHEDDLWSVVVVFVLALGGGLLLANLVRRSERESMLTKQVGLQANVLEALQLALLPRVIPAVEGASAAGTYMAGRGASATPGVGGDWYAFIPLTESRLGVGLGDVAGHGLDAVAAMAETRFALRALALDSADPGLALSRLEDTMRVFQNRHETVSAIYGVIDTSAGSWSFANAGHPPPVLRRASGEVVVLNGDRHGRVLGHMFHPESFVAHTETLAPGDLLLLYTDGLVERRGEHFDVGLRRLTTALGACEQDDLDALIRSVVESVLEGDHEDDVAVVAVRYDAVVTMPRPTPDEQRDARLEARRYVRRPGPTLARRAVAGEVVETPLGRRTARSGQWVLEGEGFRTLVPTELFVHYFEEMDEDAE